MNQILQKQEFIHQLAKFFTENAGGKSVAIQVEAQRAPTNPMPKLAHEWGWLRDAAGVQGYPTLDEAKDTLNELLGHTQRTFGSLAIVNAVNAKSGTSDTIIEFTDTRDRAYCEVVVGGRNDGAVLFHLNGGEHPGPTCCTTHEDTSWRDWEARSKRAHLAMDPKDAAAYIRSKIPNALKP